MIELIPNTHIIQIQYQRNIPDNLIENINQFVSNQIAVHGKFSIYLDLKGLNITMLMRNISWLDSVFNNVDTNHYNSFLEEVCVFNAPFISKQIYAVMKRFVKDIKHKVKFIPKNVSIETYFQNYITQSSALANIQETYAYAEDTEESMLEQSATYVSS